MMINRWGFGKLASLIPVVVISLALFGTISLQKNQLKVITEKENDALYYQRIEGTEKIKLQFFKDFPAFGFQNLIADWTLLQFIQYFGDTEARRVTGYSLNPDYLDIIVKHDPQFINGLLMLSAPVSMFSGRPDLTVKYYEEALEQLTPEMKDAYFVWLYKGVDELLFIGDPESTKKSYQKAAEWAKIAGDERIYQAATKTYNFLQNNPDSRSAQAAAWALVYSNARDDEVRKVAVANILRLGGELISAEEGAVRIKLPEGDY